jgi:hypothetical protein
MFRTDCSQKCLQERGNEEKKARLFGIHGKEHMCMVCQFHVRSGSTYGALHTAVSISLCTSSAFWSTSAVKVKGKTVKLSLCLAN